MCKHACLVRWECPDSRNPPLCVGPSSPETPLPGEPEATWGGNLPVKKFATHLDLKKLDSNSIPAGAVVGAEREGAWHTRENSKGQPKWATLYCTKNAKS